MKHTLLFLAVFSLTGCYTVLRQNGDYYSEFSENPAATQDAPASDSTDLVEAPEYPYTNYYSYYYLDSPYFPPYYHDPWGYRYGAYWAGLYIPLTWDPWYYDYYYWGGCYYPGGYPHYVPYYPNLPGPGLHATQRPYGLRNAATALQNQPLAAGVRSAQWNGSLPKRRYKSAEASATSQTTINNTAASSSRTTQRTFGSGRIESSSKNVRSGSASSKPASSSTRSAGTTGQRQYRGKSR